MSKYLYLSLLFCLSFQTVFSSTTITAQAKETGPAFYRDADGDGYGNSSEPATDYENLDGYVSNSDDCDDNNYGINPTATEVCDGFDNNCDGNIDEGVTNIYYRDDDGDGYGDSRFPEYTCSLPYGYVENSDDCNDLEYDMNPNTLWYEDRDGDGFGNGTYYVQCDQPPASYLPNILYATEGDCDDNDYNIYPSQTEICDGIDNNCDGNIDEYVKTTYYRDADDDGYGDPYTIAEFCDYEVGYVTNSDDCDDNATEINPGSIWYKDEDGDGFSDGNSIQQCSQPDGYRLLHDLMEYEGDCNDGDYTINPYASEICDGLDNNCDGEIDEGVTYTYYYDEDGDGYGDPYNSSQECYPYGNLVEDNTDCDDNNSHINPITDWYKDSDSDGYSDGTMTTQCDRPSGFYYAGELAQTDGDCDDDNSAINPAALEECDGIDNDCDGETDEGVTYTFYHDEDGDGFGDPSNPSEQCYLDGNLVEDNTDCDDNNFDINPITDWYRDIDGDGFSDGGMVTQCERPSGFYYANELYQTDGDCDDNNSEINPAASEECDGVDNDCDGQVDEGLTFTYYRDMDGDGYGDTGNFTEACTAPSGYVDNGLDCNDGDAELNPYTVWYKDFDGDLYSDGGTLTQCTQPDGYYAYYNLAALDGDCDDSNYLIHPGNSETCDGIDNNCNGDIDEGVLYAYYLDNDGDGYGDPANPTYSCSPSSGYVDDNSDCNDSNSAINPNTVWYQDADDDGYSDGYTRNGECSPPSGFKLAADLLGLDSDCDDDNNDLNPGTTEICDGIDNNCDGTIDEGFEMTTYYQDLDGDGFGNGFVSIESCFQPDHYVLNGNDCIDSDATRNPDTPWYKDADQDGYSDGTVVTGCDPIPDYYAAISLFETDGDCDDSEYNLNPGITETCDGIDNNCDGQIDEGLLTLFYLDTDGDGYGDPDHSTYLCNITGEYSWNNEDCDDSNPQINPNTEWYMDADGDHYPDDSERMVQCDQPGEGYVMSSTLYYFTTDCDDYNANIYPNAEELCDGVDNNCDGNVDEGLLNTYFADMDNDGFGDQENYVLECTMPGGYTNISGDCDDSDANIHPNTEWFKDEDGDLYGDDTSVRQCEAPDGSYHLATYFISTYQDCNDSDAAINPEAEEVCDDVDNNCDGNIDEGVSTMYYFDGDLDGFGDGAFSIQSCSPVDGYVTNNTDCDDNDNTNVPTTLWYQDLDEDGYSDGTTVAQCAQSLGLYAPEDLIALDGDCDDNNSAIHPGATEICSNGIDDDCDGFVDEDCLATTALTLASCGSTVLAPINKIYITTVTGATSYNIQLSNSGLGYSQTFNTGNNSNFFKLSSFTDLKNGTTYSVRVSVVSPAGTSSFGAACDLVVDFSSKLIEEHCGITLSSFTTPLRSNSFVGLSNYKYHITGPNGYDLEYISPTISNVIRFSTLQAISPMENSSTYNVEVAVIMNGGTGSYGQVCSITTPDLPSTTLQIASCGVNVANPNTNLFISSVSGAVSYNVQLSNSGLSYSQTINTGSSFKLSSFSGLRNGETYSARIAVVYADGTSSLGTACNLTLNYTTKLITANCNSTVVALTNPLKVNSVVGASGYRYRVTGPGGYNLVYNSPTSTNVFRMSTFHALAAMSPSTTYTIEVAVTFNGGTGPYGTACTVTTPALLRLKDLDQVGEEAMEITIYPNPFRNNLTIERQNSEQPALVSIVDLSGRLLYQAEFIGGKLELGEQLPIGMYFLNYTEGEEKRTFKVIKE